MRVAVVRARSLGPWKSSRDTLTSLASLVVSPLLLMLAMAVGLLLKFCALFTTDKHSHASQSIAVYSSTNPYGFPTFGMGFGYIVYVLFLFFVKHYNSACGYSRSCFERSTGTLDKYSAANAMRIQRVLSYPFSGCCGRFHFWVIPSTTCATCFRWRW